MTEQPNDDDADQQQEPDWSQRAMDEHEQAMRKDYAAYVRHMRATDGW